MPKKKPSPDDPRLPDAWTIAVMSEDAYQQFLADALDINKNGCLLLGEQTIATTREQGLVLAECVAFMAKKIPLRDGGLPEVTIVSKKQNR